MLPLFEQYGDSAVFVHIEPFPVEEARAGNLTLVDAAGEWGLQTEPWVFVVDNEGLVAGKFEGITSAEEVGATLSGLLDAS